MAYTAKQLADISGVSVRTLHWYDEQGLLKPAYYGEENRYRYYEKEQLLMLQQILFFRELGFKLNIIKEIIHDKNFDKMTALQEHKKNLENKIEINKQLINTINQTVESLKGEQAMENANLYKGFKDWIRNEGEGLYNTIRASETAENLTEAQEIVLQSSRQDEAKANWTKDDWQTFHDKSYRILSDLTKLIKAGDETNSRAVQSLIKAHYEHGKEFHKMSPAVYSAMAELYRAHPEYRKQLDPHHSNLVKFMAEAMEYFCKKLKK